MTHVFRKVIWFVDLDIITKPLLSEYHLLRVCIWPWKATCSYHHGQWRIQDFPEVGAPTPPGGALTYVFAEISQKLHEIERIWTRGGVQNFTM